MIDHEQMRQRNECVSVGVMSYDFNEQDDYCVLKITKRNSFQFYCSSFFNSQKSNFPLIISLCWAVVVRNKLLNFR